MLAPFELKTLDHLPVRTFSLFDTLVMRVRLMVIDSALFIYFTMPSFGVIPVDSLIRL